MQGVLPTQGGETGGTQAEGRPALGEEENQVRALELQIDALYGVPPNNSAPGVPSPFQAVQHPGVCALQSENVYVGCRLCLMVASHASTAFK